MIHDHQLLARDAVALQSLKAKNTELQEQKVDLGRTVEMLQREVSALKKLPRGRSAEVLRADPVQRNPPPRRVSADSPGVAAPASLADCDTVPKKRAFVKKMMKTAWDGYHEHAWVRHPTHSLAKYTRCFSNAIDCATAGV